MVIYNNIYMLYIYNSFKFLDCKKKKKNKK
jgi:hypothetical protein